MFWCRDVLFLFGIRSNLTLSPQRHEPRVPFSSGNTVTKQTSSYALLQLMSYQSLKQPQCLCSILQFTTGCGTGQAWPHESKQGRHSGSLLCHHTPAVRCPSASLSSTYPAPVLDPDLTHCPWPSSCDSRFPSCICCSCSRSFPGRLSRSCYPATHLNSHTLCLLPCFAELKLFPEPFPRSASEAMAHL